MLASELFIDIDSRTLAAIIERDSLTCSELDVYRACVRWLQEQRDRGAHEPSSSSSQLALEPSANRRLLGRALQEIRFPALGAKSFSDHVVREPRLECAVLTRDEIIALYEWFNASAKPQLPFPSDPRRGLPIHECVRFGTTGRNARQWRYRPGKWDAIQFAVDHRIFLVGVGLYGSSNGPADYALHIEVRGSLIPQETTNAKTSASNANRTSAGTSQTRANVAAATDSPMPSPTAAQCSSFTFNSPPPHEAASLADSDLATSAATASSPARSLLLRHACTLRTAGDDRIYAVQWGRALRIEPNRYYSVNVLLDGSELSYFGHEGLAEVTVPLNQTPLTTQLSSTSASAPTSTSSQKLQPGVAAVACRQTQAVTFQFHCSAESANGTGIHTGQIPCLLFYSS